VGIEEETMETAKKGLVDVAVNVGGKSVASGTVVSVECLLENDRIKTEEES
jgi:hypothetical protein